MEDIKTFSMLKIGSTLYAINEAADVFALVIDHISPNKAFGGIISYDIHFKFVNDDHILKFTIDIHDFNKTKVTLRPVYTYNDYMYNETWPHYLFGTDRNKLIHYYIKKLHESIDYQRKVIDEGLTKITELQDRIVTFQNLL